jgi:hypothetical protein
MVTVFEAADSSKGAEGAKRETWLHREEREDWKKRKRSSHQNSDTRQAPWTATLS